MTLKNIIQLAENELIAICNELKDTNKENIVSLCKKYKVSSLEELQEVMDIRKTTYFRLRNNKPMEFFFYDITCGIKEIRCKVVEWKNNKTCRVKNGNEIITIQRIKNSIEWIDDEKRTYLFNSYTN